MTEYITLLSLLNNYFSQAKILFHFDLLYHSKYSLSCILSNLFFLSYGRIILLLYENIWNFLCMMIFNIVASSGMAFKNLFSVAFG